MSLPKKRFGLVCNLVNGKAFKPADWSSVGVPIIRIQNLNDSGKPFNHWAGPLEKQVRVRRGDLLLAWSGTPGTSFGAHIWNGPDGVLNQHIFRCDLNTEELSKEWARIAVNRRLDRLIAQAHGGVGLQHVTRGMVEDLEIPLPPLAEQRRIAEVLDRAEALRAKRRAALAQLDTLAQAIFLEMFGDLMSDEPRWPVVAVSEFVSRFESGKSIVADDEDDSTSEYRVLKVSAVTSLEFRPEQNKAVPTDYEPPTSHIVREGDLLFSRANTAELIGATAYVSVRPKNLLLPDKLWRFAWHEEPRADPHFVRFLFQQPKFRREITQRASGTSGSMKNISQGKVLGIKVALPPLQLQRAFGAKIAAVEKLKAAQRTALAELDALFASLQHRAFRGEL